MITNEKRILARTFGFLFASLMLNCSLSAKDTGITMQTNLSSSYAGTVELNDEILDQLSVKVNTEKTEEVREALQQLLDGDVLVLSVHSNPSVFAIGNTTVQWGRFWKYFGIEEPPKLAAVLIGGCMIRTFEFEEETRYVPITVEEANFIRRRLNTKVLFLPKGALRSWQGQIHMTGLLKSLREGKKLAEIDLQGLWHYMASPELDKDNITLNDLRSPSTETERQKTLLVLLEKSLEVLDSNTKKFVRGTTGKTSTSNWKISENDFTFHSDEDGFNLSISWDDLPAYMYPLKSYPFSIQASIDGEKVAEIVFSSAMDISFWDIQAKEYGPGVERIMVNAYRLTLNGEESDELDVTEGFLPLSITPVGKGAKIDLTNGKVYGGTGKLFNGEKPGEFDAFFLMIHCNGLARMSWTYVPEGSPHLQ